MRDRIQRVIHWQRHREDSSQMIRYVPTYLRTYLELKIAEWIVCFA